MDTEKNRTSTTTAYYAQSAISFGVALLTMMTATYLLPADPWIKAFLALGTLFLTTSAFSLAKCVRDAQEQHSILGRLDQARVDKLLAEHDPYRSVG